MIRSAQRLVAVATVAVAGIVVGACGGDDDVASSGPASAVDDGRLHVVTTVSPITNIAANVIGDLAIIDGVVPEGTNSHTFEPSPSVSETLSGADIVFANGLQLEAPTIELAESVNPDATLVRLGELIVSPDDYLFDFSFPEEDGKPNPHLWTDPTLAKQYARHIADAMVEADPANADAYRANQAAFDEIMDDFDTALRTSLETVPVENRKLLTYHDAYAYWAQTYGWEVIGAVQPSDFGDPSPKDIADLIDQVRAAGVPAIFGSEVFPSPVLNQIANEADVTYVDDLRDDDLPGEPGETKHSYVGLMQFDYVTIVDALGGDPTALEAFEVRNAAPDDATYPQ